MADISFKSPQLQTISESERPKFYAWAVKNGYKRLNATIDETVEELWRDPQGQIISAGRLVIEHPDWRLPDPRDAIAPPNQEPVSQKVGSGRLTASRYGIQWLQLYPTMALTIILIGALQLAMDSRRTVADATGASKTSQVSPIVSEGTPLGLMVIPRSGQLEIRWDPKSAAVAKSDKGEMKISEDGITESVPFDQAQLRDGYVAYWRKTNDVSIRLEVTDKDGARISESVRSVTIP